MKANSPDLSTFRAILLDVDRTLTNGQGEITRRTAQAVRNAMAQGWNVALATGRSVPESVEIRKIFPSDQLHVLCAGAMLATSRGDEVWSHAIPSDTVRELCRLAVEHQAEFGFPQGEIYYCSPIKAERKIAAGMRVGETSNLEDWSTELLCISEISPEFEAVVARIPGIMVKRMISNRGFPYMDITADTASKATGAERWAEAMGLTMQQVIAVGDGENDRELLVAAGHGVAMANATIEIQAVANQVIGHCDEDGLAAWLEELSPIEY